MPKPDKGEKQKDYISRCIPIVLKEGTAKDQKQAAAICHSMWRKAKGIKLEDAMTLEGVGPTILGAGATNRPVIKGLPEMSFVERAGKEMLRVPLLILGKWKSRFGLLDFTKAKIATMIKNHTDNVVGHKISIDNRHKPEFGAIAWFEDFVEEQQDDLNLLVGYGNPTPKGKTEIADKAYQYASIEFHPNFEHPMVAALSSDELQPYVDEEGDIMPDDETTVVVDDERVIALESQLAELTQTMKTLTADKAAGDETLQQAQERIVRLEAFGREQFVKSIVLSAEGYRDPEGRAHSKVFLDWLQNIMLSEEIGEGDDVITLEAGGDEKIHAYYRRSINWLAQNMPGIVPVEPAGTERDQKKPIGGDNGEVTLSEDDKAEIVNVWGLAGVAGGGD